MANGAAMPVVIAAALLAQESDFDAMAYVRAHRDADTALVAGMLVDAKTGFEACLAISPNNSTVAYALACTESRSADTAKALEWLGRAAEWGYADADVAAWDEHLASLRNEQRFVGELDRMRKLAQKRSGGSQLVRIWDGREGELTIDLAIHPHSRCVAIGQDSGIVQLLDSRTGHSVRGSPALGSPVWALDFDKSGELLAALTWDGMLHFWSINRREEPKVVEALDAPEEWERFSSPSGASLRFDPTGQRLLAYGIDRGASLWTGRGELIHSWSAACGNDVEPAWSLGGERIARAQDEEVYFVNGVTGESAEAPFETPAPIWSVAYQPGGQLLATGHDDNYLRVWDLRSRELVFEHNFDEGAEDYLTINYVAFSPDGLWIAGSTSERGHARVMNSSTGKVVSQVGGCRRSYDAWPTAEPHELSWSSNSQRLWFASLFGSTSAIELTTSDETPQSPEFYGRAPKAGPPGLAVASCLRSVLALDARTGRCRWNRTNLGREGEILKTSTGHFTTDLESLDDLWIDSRRYDAKRNWSGRGRAPYPLANCVAALFDPKRVRAARDGVMLVTAKF